MIGCVAQLEEFIVLLDCLDVVLESHHVFPKYLCSVQSFAHIVVCLQNSGG